MIEKQTTKYLDGSWVERYYIKGTNKLHREDGPAIIHYYENGNIEEEYYFINGKSHREDGPADIWYDKNGNIQSEWYYINNKEVTKEHIERIRFNKKFEEYMGGSHV